MMLGFELALLDELGLGLDLSACALTGAVDGLAYVSPRTGRAVTEAAGAPWADRLLPLPRCLFTEEAPGWSDLVDGFALTGHFLARNIWVPVGRASRNRVGHSLQRWSVRFEPQWQNKGRTGKGIRAATDLADGLHHAALTAELAVGQRDQQRVGRCGGRPAPQFKGQRFLVRLLVDRDRKDVGGGGGARDSGPAMDGQRLCLSHR